MFNTILANKQKSIKDKFNTISQSYTKKYTTFMDQTLIQ